MADRFIPNEAVNVVSITIPEEQIYPEEFETQALLNLPTLDPNTLCSSCFSLAFKDIGMHSKIRMGDFDPRLTRERSFPELLKNVSRCFFCQKMVLIFLNWSRQKCGSLPMSKLGRITVTISPHWLHSVERDEYGQVQGSLLRLGVEFLLWEFTPPGDGHSPNFVFQKCNKPLLHVSDFCENGTPEDWLAEVAQPYCGRVRPLLADLRLFHKWKGWCKSQHGGHCGGSFTADRLNRMRLIDVEKGCLTEDHEGQDYVALSYVWGNANVVKLESSNLELFRRPGALWSETLPATIADALVVIRGLGERYLWVDSLCIIQDDEADKQYFIPNMDSVYGHALLTIIALAGESADAGLAGVSPGSRSRMEVPFSVRTHSIIASLDPVRMKSWDNYMGESTWDHRGWTFQERIFSRRALIFTAEQIYWECQQASWCEEGIWEVNKPPHIYRNAFQSAQLSLPWLPDQRQFEIKYRLLVEKYSLRKLSFQSDAFNAFAGVLHALEKTWSQSFFWCLPLSLFSSALQWKVDRDINPQRRVASINLNAGDGVMISAPIPSWTWLGWENGVSMANFDSHGMAVELTIYRIASSGQLVQIREAEEQPIRLEIDTLRRKWKKNIEAVVHVESLPEEILRHPFKLTFLYFWSSSALLLYHWTVDFWGKLRPILKSWDREIRFAWMQVPANAPTILGNVQELVPREVVGTSVGEFVVVGRDMHSHVGGCGDMLMLMLIERKGEIVYRRGLVSVAEEDWVSITFRWKLFVLG